jgi:hypothetical protein
MQTTSSEGGKQTDCHTYYLTTLHKKTVYSSFIVVLLSPLRLSRIVDRIDTPCPLPRPFVDNAL